MMQHSCYCYRNHSVGCSLWEITIDVGQRIHKNTSGKEFIGKIFFLNDCHEKNLSERFF